MVRGTVQLLQKQSIVSMTGAEKLLEVIPGPISKYLPENTKKIGRLYDVSMRRNIVVSAH